MSPVPGGMKTIGDRIEAFSVTGVKPGFNHHEEKGVSAFETITEASFPGKWKIIYFWPKDLAFVCPTEITGFARLARDFADPEEILRILDGLQTDELCPCNRAVGGDEELKTQREELRMNAYATHGGVDKRRFELFALTGSIVGKCHFCVASHYRLLNDSGMSALQLRDVGRIAAVIGAAANVLAAELEAQPA